MHNWLKMNHEKYFYVNGERIQKVIRQGTPLIETDLRSFVLRFSPGFREVYTNIHQLDLLKIIKMSKQTGNKYMADKFTKFIKQCDEIDDGRKTDFRRTKIPKRHI